jgi:hypothetical protein
MTVKRVPDVPLDTAVAGGWLNAVCFVLFGEVAEAASFMEVGFLRKKATTASGSGLTPQRFAHASGRVL